ncbi:uncharacterized protein YlxW (UPF0749 family) [Chryseobacterium vietnamense]|uniref:hypothetical protein n=1 Tax=Chryseobacterium vietnamense TaxID=866785 RepID=UPI002860A88F|nr:hypothetical protein [Chryseobacterium vietnamense]MDR6489284.1 uncharacterized protein YlxW (UPF0749 family) [Chryseobacterium vietnamense]
MKNILLILLFLSVGAPAQIQIDKNKIETVEKKRNSRKNNKSSSKKLSAKNLKNKISHHQKKTDSYKKVEQKSSSDKTESIVIYERSYSVKYGVYLFMNHDADKNKFSETLAFRDFRNN